LHTISQYNNSFLIILCSMILNYIYHLCALDVVALGIDDIIVQTHIKYIFILAYYVFNTLV
jgi:hypothetical protein